MLYALDVSQIDVMFYTEFGLKLSKEFLINVTI